MRRLFQALWSSLSDSRPLAGRPSVRKARLVLEEMEGRLVPSATVDVQHHISALVRNPVEDNDAADQKVQADKAAVASALATVNADSSIVKADRQVVKSDLAQLQKDELAGNTTVIQEDEARLKAAREQLQDDRATLHQAHKVLRNDRHQLALDEKADNKGDK